MIKRDISKMGLLKQIILYTLIFLISYAFFYGYNYAEQKIHSVQESIEKELQKKHIYVHDINFNIFSRSLSIGYVEYKNPSINKSNNKKREKSILAENIMLKWHIFDWALYGTADLGTGKLTTKLDIDSYTKPSLATLNLECSSVNISKYWDIFKSEKLTRLLNIEKGALNVTFNVEIPIKSFKAQLEQVKGDTRIRVQDVFARHSIPLLNIQDVENTNLNIDANWKGTKIQTQTSLQNPFFNISQHGEISLNLYKPSNSLLKMYVQVDIEEKYLNTAFVPKRTLNSIQKSNSVKMNISKRISQPYVEIIQD